MAKVQRPYRLYHYLPLTVRVFILTMVVGSVVWAVTDYFEQIATTNLFTSHLSEMLYDKALEYRIRFNRYVNSHQQLAKVVASQNRMVSYLEDTRWPSQLDEKGPRVHNSAPPWVPDTSLLRTYVSPRHFILLDKDGTVKEYYGTRKDALPEGLAEPSRRLVLLTLDESHLTLIRGRPFVVASTEVKDKSGRLLCTLMLASPIDEGFLVNSQGTPAEDIIVALVDESQKIVVSSKMSVVPKGTDLDSYEDRFLITGQEFYEFGGSELNFKFASLTDRRSLNAFTNEVVRQDRIRHGIQAAVLILAISFLMYLSTRRIRKMTERITEFSREALGGQHLEAKHWDEIYVLEERFHLLTEEVLNSAEAIRRETEQRTKKEEELKRKDRQLNLLQLVTEATGIGVAIYKEGQLTPVNSQMEHYSAMCEGLDCFDVGEGVTEEREVRFSDGTVHVFSLSSPDIGLGEKVVLTIDITERKRSEEALVESEERNRALVNAMPDMIFRIDKDGVVVDHKPFKDSEGFGGHADIKGKNVRELFPEDVAREIMTSITNVIMTGEMGAADYQLTEGRKTRSYEARFVLSGDDEVIGIIRDITEHRALEDELRHSQKVQALGTLTGGIAHEFNNIITAVMGFSEILGDSMSEDDPMKPYVEMIESSANRAARLTSGLLAYSRKQAAHKNVVNVNEIIKTTNSLLENLLGENIRLKVDISDEDLTVLADSSQLEQVIMNLSTNAMDAMPDGGVLTVSSERAELDETMVAGHERIKEGTYAVIKVSDTGHGIDEEHMEDIFEPFFTTKEVGKGTGLGLSVVYGIIKKHKGYIFAESEVGKGTTFNIYLPLNEEGAAQQADTGDKTSETGTETVLLAEDDDIVRSLIEGILTGAGYGVITAVDGEDAVEKFSENADEIDILLFDFAMPRKNGLEAYEDIRAKKKDIGVVFMSGYVYGDSDKLSETYPFVSKPVKKDVVLSVIREVLSVKD